MGEIRIFLFLRNQWKKLIAASGMCSIDVEECFKMVVRALEYVLVAAFELQSPFSDCKNHYFLKKGLRYILNGIQAHRQ